PRAEGHPGRVAREHRTYLEASGRRDDGRVVDRGGGARVVAAGGQEARDERERGQGSQVTHGPHLTGWVHRIRRTAGRARNKLPNRVVGPDMTASPTTVPTITLNDGQEIPQLGFGGFLVPPDGTQRTGEQ